MSLRDRIGIDVGRRLRLEEALEWAAGLADNRQQAPKNQFAPDSPLERAGFELVWGFSCQVVVLVCCRFFVRSGKAVLRPIACDQVRGARGRGQGTETLAKLGGLPPSGACVSQRLEA